MTKIRAFIAIHLPQDVRQALGKLSTVLADQLPPRSVRWVQPDRMHLTLRFLGDTPAAKLAEIGELLDAVTAAAAPFRLQLGEVGCFPNCGRPRVIWVGTRGDTEQLAALKKSVDLALEPMGWEVETRPFRAHLTLGRVKDSRKLAGIDWQGQVTPLSIPVMSIHLVESQLRPAGPIYTDRHTSLLAARG